MDSLEILRNATRRGLRTSEFWLAVVGIAVVGLQSADHEMAVAVIAAAYAIARAIVKAATTKALLTDVEPPTRVVERHDIHELR